MKSDFLLKFFPVPKFLKPEAVGFDISDHSIKFLELLRGENGYHLGRLGEIEVPAGTIEGGELKNPEVLKQILLQLKSKWHFHNVFISLPDDHAYTFGLTLPIMKVEEIAGSVELQVEEYVPLPGPEIVFDFNLIEPNEAVNQISVGVSAISRKLVESYQAVFASAGLNLLAIGTQGEAVTRTLAERGKKSEVVIVDLGKNHTAIFWVKNGTVIHSATAPVGGEAMTNNLQKVLKIDFAEAEKIKMTKGLLRSAENKTAFETMIPVASAIREEIERRISFWLEQEKMNLADLEQVILIGGQALLPGLAEYLGSHLGRPVVLGNPWFKVFSDRQKVSELSYNEAMRYCTAIGLALRNFE